MPVHILLFFITFVTTLIAGISWTTGAVGPYTLTDLASGLPYALSVLFMLSAHEFGHYFAAKYHKVKVTLPYYIPFPPLPGFFNFGTMGAVIKTRTAVKNNIAMFDIGIAGPLSGFVACLILIIYGFTHLPGPEYILAIHPDFFSDEYGKQGISLAFGDTLLFAFLREILTNPVQFVPPMSEIYHYPYLCVGWFGLFVTAMNMIPVGQLDGGHIVYSMFGSKKHEAVASISIMILGVLGFMGILDYALGLKLNFGWVGWAIWATILLFIMKINHPIVQEFNTLDKKRKTLGYLTLFIFIICFSPTPFYGK
ncbi:MAG: peptidase [Ignavibacteria bacterium GWB2_35_6b]|nr:MAG: peptidase [Ignavibacteria bacterium GWB2_35_6b]